MGAGAGDHGENFAGAIGTVTSSPTSRRCARTRCTPRPNTRCSRRSPRSGTYLSSGAGYVATATGLPLFFVISVVVAVPSLILLAWLQRRTHFETLGTVRV